VDRAGKRLTKLTDQLAAAACRNGQDTPVAVVGAEGGPDLRQENAELKRTVEGFAERIAAQSELLSRNAERPPDGPPAAQDLDGDATRET
jgi:hypothetical protein